MKNGRYKLTPKRFLFMYLVISMILGMYYLCYTGGECLKLILQEADFCFMDFFNHIYYVKEPQCVYDVNFNACFPPLAYMLYWLLSRMIPVDGLAINDASSFTSYGILLFCIYHILMGILFYAVISGLLKSCGEKFCLLFTLLICVSNVFIFSVVWTGNAALLACIVLLKAFELRDREDKRSRELALLLIAAAAGLKIYPALFGIFYLKEKRYREAVRLIIYGIVFFFVPFVFFRRRTWTVSDAEESTAITFCRILWMEEHPGSMESDGQPVFNDEYANYRENTCRPICGHCHDRRMDPGRQMETVIFIMQYHDCCAFLERFLYDYLPSTAAGLFFERAAGAKDRLRVCDIICDDVQLFCLEYAGDYGSYRRSVLGSQICTDLHDGGYAGC